MYFAILGKNKILSKEEIKICLWNNVLEKDFWKIVFLKECISTKILERLAWTIKWGKVVDEDYVKNFLEKNNFKLLWTNDKSFWNTIKNLNLVKRFKIIDLEKSDFEVKTKWVEILKFNSFYLLVLWYQNISLYETIDFWKPVKSMKIWMMPSKLTHMLLNFSVWCSNSEKRVYDPFCWLWTTLFVANFFSYNTIWSDLNISPAKQNLKWRKTTEYYKKNFYIGVFKQDITKPFKNKLVYKTTNVVTEWYLGPVINNYISLDFAEKLEDEVWKIYYSWIKNLLDLPNLEKIVITFPVYFLKNKRKYIFEKTFDEIKKLKIELNVLPEIYYRKWQKVWRMIVLIKKKGDCK